MDNNDCLKKSEEIRSDFNIEKHKMYEVIQELHSSFNRLQEIYKKCTELASKL